MLRTPGAEMLSEKHSADAKLLHGFSSGSKEGFAAFYDRFSGAVFSTACRILGEGKAAEEAMQEAFVQMWRCSAQLDPSRRSVFTWAIMITRNEALRRLRSSGSLVPDEKPASTKHSTETAQASEATSLRPSERSYAPAVFAFLTSAEQEALELCFFDGFTASEVSAKLGIPPGNLAATVRRGLFGFLHALSNGAVARPSSSGVEGMPVVGVTANAV
ncbi:MAG: sigma-70 family RNA polymerase sigma factor [Verrucomicrobiota bacterium]|nr:sigma-70 family RNA polymerase sigma factor [Verrucomicrobiota bacterium]